MPAIESDASVVPIVKLLARVLSAFWLANISENVSISGAAR